MSNELQQCQFGNEFAPWQSGAAFNTYYTYTFINNSVFYSLIPAFYRPFMQRLVQNWAWWNDGWVPYFHNQDKGVMSTQLASSLVKKISRKVIGARVMFKNAGKLNDKQGSNYSRSRLSHWADATNFDRATKRAADYAAGLGTSLMKLNIDENRDLWTEAVRFDRFLPTVDAATGRLREVKSFLMTTVDYEHSKGDEFQQVYNLIERRYYGDFKTADGKVERNVPLIEYSIMRATGSVTNGTFSLYNGTRGECIPWQRLPETVRQSIRESYGLILFDTPRRLPFVDLGAELINWTEGIAGLPQMPFGESVLAHIMPHLMLFDYHTSAVGTDMYLGRGRVMLPKGIDGQANRQGVENWDAGLDSMAFVKIPYVNPDDQKPLPVQFDLRSEEWKSLRNLIFENIAVALGLSPSTIAAFLNDSSARTAREVSTEENETAAYVADTRAIIETPINRILDTVRKYYGLPDKVVVRWAQSGLSNPYITTEMMTQQVSAGLISIKDAIMNLNPDDDEEQIIIKTADAKRDWEERQLGNKPFDDSESGGGYFGGLGDDSSGIEPTSGIVGNSANGNQKDAQG